MELEVTSGNDASMVVKLTLDAFTAEKLLAKKPRSLPTATFCALLIEQALDTPGMMAERAKASVASTLLSSSLKDKSNKNICKDLSSRKSRKRPDYTDEFLAFWNEYQKAPTKAIGQSKYKAFDQWRAAVKREAPEKLVEAARRAVELVTQAKLRDEWCAPLPDAFRWLRDEHYAVHLEGHVPAGPRIVNGYTVYD